VRKAGRFFSSKLKDYSIRNIKFNLVNLINLNKIKVQISMANGYGISNEIALDILRKKTSIPLGMLRSVEKAQFLALHSVRNATNTI
jgi:hypothetical protein